MSAWKLPPIEGGHGGCLSCPPTEQLFHADNVIAVGFGDACLSRNGTVVWCENMGADQDYMTGAQAESMAAELDPECAEDWRISMQGPLRGRTYQRHAPGQWVLVEKNRGFA